MQAIEKVDAVVVGTGFGGAVAAYRLASAGFRVVVLERGKAYPPGSFARTPAEFSANFWAPEADLYGLWETWSFRGLEGVVSSGLGGGSLVYANVLLRKDAEWFVRDEPIPGGGYETWPIGRADLDPHYDRVEQMIGADPYPFQDTPKTIAFEAAARAAGLPVIRPPLGVSFSPLVGGRPRPDAIPEAPYGNLHGSRRFTCTLCGECDIGCNVGAKNTLDHTYLSAAVHAGADLRTLHDVKGFHRLDGGWEVRYRVHEPGADVPAADRVLHTRRLVLAAGTFGSTHLVLKNRASLPGLSPAVGTRFSGNGDLLGFLRHGGKRVDQVARSQRLTASRGPVITSVVRVADRHDGDPQAARGYYIEDAGYPGFLDWLVEAAQVRSLVSRSTRTAARLLASRLVAGGRSNISRDLASALGKSTASSGFLPVLGMGRDIPDGRLYLDRGRLAVDWTTKTSIAYFDALRATMAQLAEAMGTEFVDNPLWWAKRVITVHPLGGNPMGRTWQEGVVDAWGRVFGSEGLWIVDGSTMPGPVGPNPALTIAAFADRCLDRLISDAADEPLSRARPDHAEPASAEHAAQSGVPVDLTTVPDPKETTKVMEAMEAMEATPPTAVRFTEQMKGYLRLGGGDPVEAYEDARVQGEQCMFEVTITTDDIDAFVEDPSHTAAATGYVEADALGGRVEIVRGWFNLLIGVDETRAKQMLYRLWLAPESGDALTLVGYKDVRDDPGLDLWTDTTTLFVQLLDGHIEPDPGAAVPLLEASDGRVAGAGILRISPLAFARQLATFRSDGPLGGVAIGRFAALFLGDLWDTYAGLVPVGP